MSERKLERSKQEEKNVRVRCAIYTRKSTEEGLDQDFNSLHAQREAAQAFIASQKHLGWIALPNHYDDGGFGGGSLDRPALQQLLTDIEARRVDCVVVYKVDRLSRSLLDFARLIDRFEQRSVSFVSVTQQFNTTASLGRLTLNILLSFAQFERELIGERTRDKMAAARRKGKWVGGTPVLGYDIDPGGGRLIINPKEATRVRKIFELYRKHGPLDAVVEELNRRGWSTKSWKSKRGLEHGGRPFTPVSLFRLLTNIVYTGKIEYRGTIYDGEQPPIIEFGLWQEVNAALRKPTPKLKPPRHKHDALLVGIAILRKLPASHDPNLFGQGQPPLPVLRVPRGAREWLEDLLHQVGLGHLDRGLAHEPASRPLERRSHSARFEDSRPRVASFYPGSHERIRQQDR